jgi:lipopolysaccharide export system permease protein
MRRYDRHVLVLMGQSYLAVALVLATLASFIELVQQLDDVGEQGYGLAQAVLYVLLVTPRRLADLAPLIALVGTLIPVGLLADARELVALRALGVRQARVVWSVLQPGAALAVLAALAIQLAVAPLEQRAITARAAALAQDILSDTTHGFWSRGPGAFLNVERVEGGRTPVGVDIYELAPDGRLRTYTHAARAQVRGPQDWLLEDVTVKDLTGGRVKTSRAPELAWPAFLDAGQVGVLLLPPEALAPLELWRYVDGLRARGESAARLELVLWQQLAQPFTTLAMVALAVPLVLVIPRGTGLSRSILLGVVLGVAYYFAAQSVGYLGLVGRMPAPLTALAPPLVAAFAAGLMLRRLR